MDRVPNERGGSSLLGRHRSVQPGGDEVRPEHPPKPPGEQSFLFLNCIFFLLKYILILLILNFLNVFSEHNLIKIYLISQAV